MWSGTCYAGTGMYVVCIQWVSRFGNYIFLTAFDPQLKITAVRGKVFDGQDKRVLQLKKSARRRSLFRVFGRQCNGAISKADRLWRW